VDGDTMKKITLAVVVFIILAGGFLLSAGGVLATKHPYRPGELLFPTQELAEEIRLKFSWGSVAKALYLIEIADERVFDLALVSGQPDEVFVLESLNSLLDRILTTVQVNPESADADVRSRLTTLLQKITNVLYYMDYTKTNHPDLYQAFEIKVSVITEFVHNPLTTIASISNRTELYRSALPSLLSEAAAQAATNLSNSIQNPLAVPFPPGSSGA
jgi:hypothetical protein